MSQWDYTTTPPGHTTPAALTGAAPAHSSAPALTATPAAHADPAALSAVGPTSVAAPALTADAPAHSSAAALTSAGASPLVESAFVELNTGGQALSARPTRAVEQGWTLRGLVAGVAAAYRVTAGTDAQSLPAVVRPPNFDAATNAFVYKVYP